MLKWSSASTIEKITPQPSAQLEGRTEKPYRLRAPHLWEGTSDSTRECGQVHQS